MNQENPSKTPSFSKWVIAVIATVVIGVVGVVLTLGRNQTVNNTSNGNGAATNDNINAVTNTNSSDAASQTYTHERGFSIKYPGDWSVMTLGSDSTTAAFKPRGVTYIVEESDAYPVYISVRDESVEDFVRGVEGDRLASVTIGANTLTRLDPKGTVSSTSYLIDLPRGSLSVGDHVDEIIYTNGLTDEQADRMRAVLDEMLASLVISQ